MAISNKEKPYMKKMALFLLACSSVMADEECDGCPGHHFQTLQCESEPDWSYIKDESDWPGKREDDFVEALKGN